MSRRDKRALSVAPGEYNVARFITDEEGARDLPRNSAHVHDTDAVRKEVHHPNLGVVSGRDRHGLETDRNRVDPHGTARAEIEYFEPAVWCVGDVEPLTVWRDH